MSGDRIHAGGCLCGAVRFRLWGRPMNVCACHCTLCQKALGSPFFLRVLVSPDQLEVEGETAEFNSSSNLARAFCPRCGTRLFARGLNDPPRVGVAVSTLDDPSAFPPECHIFTSTKQPWLELSDGLPQYAERP